MLKTRRGSEVWLITQPAHAELSGRLAAHWGNPEFARPGHFSGSGDAGRLRREVVLAVAEHDNGWWEWEADPPLSDEDGLPQGLGEVLRDPLAGMERWRLGISRLEELHPYAGLLISDHAYRLYASQFERDLPPEFAHHLQGGKTLYPAELEQEARVFLARLREQRGKLEQRLGSDPFWREALEPAERHPNARLLQVLDAFSLALCSAALAPVEGPARGLGEDHILLGEVPRLGWGERGPLELRPEGEGRIAVHPYPFDQEPLIVSVPARVGSSRGWWRRLPWVLKAFTLRRA